jgi:hypothetical protein
VVAGDRWTTCSRWPATSSDQGRWLPLEDREDPKITSQRRSIVDRDAWAPHGLKLGDVGALYLFTCTVCAERPLAGTMQCS